LAGVAAAVRKSRSAFGGKGAMGQVTAGEDRLRNYRLDDVVALGSTI
jgi:hypothetical protein